MSTEYAGISVFPTTITVLQDGDESPAASVAVALEQLADRTRWLWTIVTGGAGAEFTDAILHGDTTFPDGTIDATGVTDLTVVASNAVTIAAAAGEAFLGGNTVALGSTTTVTATATTNMILTAGGDLTVSVGDDIIITGAAGSVFDLWGGRVIVPAGAGAIEFGTSVILGGGGGDTVTVNAGTLALGTTDIDGSAATCNATFGGVFFLSSTSQNELEIGGSFIFNGKLRIRSENRSDANFSVDGTTAYEHIFPDNPASTRSIPLANTGAARGQRVRFNAQNVVTGANDFQVTYGLRTWNMRNAAGKTVVMEFVYDGTAWVIDDWAEGGSALRNG